MADFAVELLKLTSLEESMVMSPLSLAAALSVLERGAGGVTKREIVEALRRRSQHDVPELFRKLGKSDGVFMAMATKLYVAPGFEISHGYNAAVSMDFGATAEGLDFRNQALTVKTVNEFVSKTTREMLPRLLPGDYFMPDMCALLVNAVYFKGKWEVCFNKEHTQKDIFRGVKGDREEPFMYKRGMKNSRFCIAEGTQVLALPYKDNEYEFVIFLPSGRVKFEDFRNELNGAKMTLLLKSAIQETEGVDVKIPKFKVESEPNMKKMLQTLGINTLFTSACDLKGMSATDLYVDDVIHKAIVEVSEEGTEAAAVAAAMMTNRAMMMNPEFIADRPFVYGIFKSDEPIFIGQYC